MLAMMLLLMLASAVLAAQDDQCLEHGACAAQCAASLRVCIADCSPTPPEEPEEGKGLLNSKLRLLSTNSFRPDRNFPRR